MNKDLNHIQREQLSALADGQLAPEDIASALAFAEGAGGRQTWQLYQLVGEVLRSPDLAHHAQHDLLSGVRAQLAKELRPGLQPPSSVAMPQGLADSAANSGVFRWRLAAGLASVVAVSALAWSSLYDRGSAAAAAVQLAESAVFAPSESAAGVNGTQLMLRDPRLDELLAAQRQYSSVSALTMPANFLRNANFSASPVRP